MTTPTMQTVAYKRGYLHYSTVGDATSIRAQNECGESKEFSSERAAKEWLNRYNGHKNWTHWNVSLYLNNEYNLYQLCLEALKQNRNNPVRAARGLIAGGWLPTRTPDGAKYSHAAVEAALRDMVEG
ncbi:hypothetical protein [Burkholderia ubonensis]|uniref:DUF7249 family protein n=1 Tax=Burkholderia ubonensis TaxID=101571 RepID=UPI000A590C0A|nr:hypothetical protein [Burkholderia ubonensis]